MADKMLLTEKFIKALPTLTDKRVYYPDTAVNGFSVCVTPTGAKSYVLFRRWPPLGIPARRLVGKVGQIGLADARKRADEWIRMAALGQDPKVEKAKAKQAELEKREVTFASVAEEWFAAAVRKQRRGASVERDVRREFFPLWEKSPIADITPRDISVAIGAKAVATPSQARNLLGHLKCFFGWAIGQHRFGIAANPTIELKAKVLVGKKVKRQRTLEDDELVAFWKAASETEYPYGAVFRLMLLTGARERVIADAVWKEIDFVKREWRVPASRMKTDAPFVLPLTDRVVAILESLPRFKRGDHLFSTNYGVSGVNGFGWGKVRLDRKMADELGRAPDHFVLHDLRRTARTHWSALPIPTTVCELLLAHAQQGMHAVYDQHKYLAEKRDALLLWEKRLMGIVNSEADPQPEPQAAEIIDLATRRAVAS
jgi:integrase